ncbi:MAG: hypothetical protein IJB26_00540 [Clostridia bacterium]|nr:hypothetical protein [Clostridia bacterium]
MKRLFKISAKLWLRMAFATFLCFIVWTSIYAMATALTNNVVGYRLYQEDENGNDTLLLEHYYAEGEDKDAEIPLKDGQSIIQIREIPDSSNVVTAVISSAFTLTIFGVFPYNALWRRGSKDNNLVVFGRAQEDLFFGLKVGCLVNVPSILLYVTLILGKLGIVGDAVIKWHRILNAPFIPYIDAVEQGVQGASQLSIESLLAVGATLLFVPVIATVAYYLGYRQISLRERLIYKKDKE